MGGSRVQEVSGPGAQWVQERHETAPRAWLPACKHLRLRYSWVDGRRATQRSTLGRATPRNCKLHSSLESATCNAPGRASGLEWAAEVAANGFSLAGAFRQQVMSLALRFEWPVQEQPTRFWLRISRSLQFLRVATRISAYRAPFAEGQSTSNGRNGASATKSDDGDTGYRSCGC